MLVLGIWHSPAGRVDHILLIFVPERQSVEEVILLVPQVVSVDHESRLDVDKCLQDLVNTLTPMLIEFVVALESENQHLDDLNSNFLVKNRRKSDLCQTV